MTTQEIIEGNKLISETFKEINLNLCRKDLKNTLFLPESMKYNSSWDWLMPIIEKVESLGYIFVFTQSVIGFKTNGGKIICAINSRESKFDRTLQTVINFIKEYNLWEKK